MGVPAKHAPRDIALREGPPPRPRRRRRPVVMNDSTDDDFPPPPGGGAAVVVPLPIAMGGGVKRTRTGEALPKLHGPIEKPDSKKKGKQDKKVKPKAGSKPVEVGIIFAQGHAAHKYFETAGCRQAGQPHIDYTRFVKLVLVSAWEIYGIA